MSLFTAQPINSGSRALDVALNMIQNAVKSAFDTLEAGLHSLLEPAVVQVTDNFQVTTETIVDYAGAGGHKLVLPPANSITGRRSRLRLFLCNGAGPGFGFFTLVPSGNDTVNGISSGIAITPPAMFVAISNGVDRWNVIRSAGPAVTVDPVTSGSVASISATVRASGDTSHNTSVQSMGYTLDFQGHNLPANIVGLNIVGTEKDMGTGNPDHYVIFAGAGPVGSIQTLFYVKAAKGATPAQARVGGDLTVTGALSVSGSPINFSTARMATPTTLADVIAVVQAFGLTS